MVWIVENKKLIQQVVITTFVVGLLAHGFAYFNVYFTHDALYNVSQSQDIYLKISTGRFLQPLNILFRGTLVIPWLVGFLSLFWLSISNFLLIKLLNIRSKVSISIVCALMVTNVSLILVNSSYFHESDSFMISLIFAILSVYIFERFKYGFIVTPVLIMISLGFYQAYFQVTVALFMIVCIKDILSEEDVFDIINKAIKIIVCLVIGLVLYSITYRCVLSFTGISAGVDYNSLNNVGQFISIPSIVELIVETYQISYSTYMNPETVNVDLVKYLNIIIIGLSTTQIIVTIKRNKSKIAYYGLVVLWLVLFPFALNVVNFISNSIYHSLMIFSYILVYVLALDLFDNEETGRFQYLGSWAIKVACVIIVFFNVVYANQLYLRKVMIYDTTMATMNRVIDRMEQVEGYVVGKTPVVIYGELNYSPLSRPQTGFENVWGLGMTNFGITYSYSSYFNNVLGYPITLTSLNEAGTNYAKTMPAFPENDYCQMVDGVLIVKLSDKK